MTISKDLFLAILSMDAYNREYSAGIDIVGSSLGFAQLVNRESLGIDASAYQDRQDAGFYAVAYKMASGEEIAGLSVGDTIISYRGTDNPDPLTWEDGASDVWQGWITGAGIPGSQSLLALDCNGTRRSRSAADEPEHLRLRLATTWS